MAEISRSIVMLAKAVQLAATLACIASGISCSLLDAVLHREVSLNPEAVERSSYDGIVPQRSAHSVGSSSGTLFYILLF